MLTLFKKYCWICFFYDDKKTTHTTQTVFLVKLLSKLDVVDTDQQKYVNYIVYMLWFNFILGLNFIFFCFKLIIIHFHTQTENKIKFKPWIKLNHNT